MNAGHLTLIAGALLAAGLLASLVATRLRVPSLVLFLVVGMVIGSDGLGWIPLDDYGLARTIGSIALALILFDGGLSAGLRYLRPALVPAISLALIGTLITAFVVGAIATLIFHLSLRQGLLLGSILSTTDGAAVFALLSSTALSHKLAATLEGESGFNDPVAVLLVIGLINTFTHPGYGFGNMVLLFVEQLGIGLALGVIIGLAAAFVLRRLRLQTSGLYPVASIAVAALAFGAADSLHGSGFLAVYLAGLILGTAPIQAERTIVSFHRGLGWLAQVTMFLTLGLLVFPHELPPIALRAALLAVALIVLARPLAAGIALLPFHFQVRERLLLAWAGLRGAIPVVLATFAVSDHVNHSLEFFDVAFFVVLLSALLQGSTVEPLARKLGLAADRPVLARPLTQTGTNHALGAELFEYTVGAEDTIAGARVSDLELAPDGALTLIMRTGEAVVPSGSMELLPGDELHVLVSDQADARPQDLIDRWRRGPR
jgi:cell volume regulation protein A